MLWWMSVPSECSCFLLKFSNLIPYFYLTCPVGHTLFSIVNLLSLFIEEKCKILVSVFQFVVIWIFYWKLSVSSPFQFTSCNTITNTDLCTTPL